MMTDQDGNPIPEDDPRLPSDEDVTAALRRASALLAEVQASGVNPEPIATLAAQIDALVAILVPPDGPVRRLFHKKVQENRAATFERILKARGPSLTVARAVPETLPPRLHRP